MTTVPDRATAGSAVWSAAPAKPECLIRRGCSAAEEGPATLIPGAVLLGSLDEHLRAYDSHSGSLIWDFDTLRDFRTVNGVKASGGSLSFAGLVAGLGMLFVDSGYSTNAGIPCNASLHSRWTANESTRAWTSPAWGGSGSHRQHASLKAVRNRSRNPLIGQTGASGPGSMPSCQPQLDIRASTAGSWAMIETGTS